MTEGPINSHEQYRALREHGYRKQLAAAIVNAGKPASRRCGKRHPSRRGSGTISVRSRSRDTSPMLLSPLSSSTNAVDVKEGPPVGACERSENWT